MDKFKVRMPKGVYSKKELLERKNKKRLSISKPVKPKSIRTYKVRIREKAYKLANQEKMRSYKKTYRDKPENKEKMKAYLIEWRKKNPEKYEAGKQRVKLAKRAKRLASRQVAGKTLKAEPQSHSTSQSS